MTYFITGTDTEVGKTYFTNLLIRALREAGKDAVGMKPIACGSNEDTGILVAASGNDVSLSDLNPEYFEHPVAPLTAANLAGRAIDVDRILAAHHRLTEAHEIVIVEGAGGWQTPILADFTMGDLARSMDATVVVVVANKLGALNHTLLTLASIKHFGLPCAGIVFNHIGSCEDIAAQTNRRILDQITAVPILWELAADQTKLDDVAAVL